MNVSGFVFETKLGWLGIAGADGTVWSLTIGHPSREAAWSALSTRCAESELQEADWHPQLRRRLTDFAAGRCETFDDIRVRDEPRTEFQRNVLRATRSVGFGETISYGDLAARAGSPRAARAVGAVMASNHIPIIIPCHRVVGARGELTGFSAPRGIQMKRQLLAMERAASESARGRQARGRNG